ncbi:SusC/RagA family TonB-linked outer membrane protein [Chitinophaga pinensis]|uniref:TonB-dependent receptor n=1 Tax=Chitinophaga pinensis TaxID=79329 RepID=A0A5C6LRP0_9BACT|nr:TonB-dependent receptor [Chitinophaga pinensis]TWV96262.1 TonB-dependent receptor [Chitinophaga pinensis]
MKRSTYDACVHVMKSKGGNILFFQLLFIGAIILSRPGQTTAQKRDNEGAALTKTISGQVIDSASGNVLEGVTIGIAGTQSGAISGKDGRFSVKAPEGQTLSLYVRLVGYREIRVPYTGSGNLLIRLPATTAGLNQVIVTGYSTQKKATVTGAVSVIKASELVTTKNENVINMMTGKLPGLRVVQKSSEPGAYDNVFDIRGMGNPLVVIDGVPRGGGDLARMDPNEIESISILKDASAAIYGVQAANGVIVVTSKKGSRNPNGKFDITYAVNQSWQQFLNVPQGVDALQYMMLKNEKQKRDFGNNFYNQMPPSFSDADMELYKNGTLNSSDWVGATMREFAPETQHTLSVNGGNDRANYFFNLGYFNQDGLFRTNDMNYDRWNFRSNINAKINDRMRAQLLLSGYTDTKNQPGGRGVWEMFKYTWNQLPTDQIYANNNPLYPHLEPDNANPVVMTNADIVGSQAFKNKNFQGQLALEYDIPGIQGLMARGMYNYGFNIVDNTMVRKSYNLYEYDRQNDKYIPTLVNSPSTVNRTYGNNTASLYQLSLNYTRQFAARHNVTGLLLYEENHATADNFYAQREFSLGLPYLFAGNETNQLGNMDGNGLWETVNKGLVGKLNYDFKSKYLFDFSFRYGGSSKFKPGAQWGFFPAVSVGWRLSEERFIQSILSPTILNNLKLRASYGKTGDDSATGFQYISGYNYPSPGYFFGGNYVNGMVSRGVVNPDLTWYTAKTLNLGVEFDLLKGLLGGSVDYFIRNRSGLLATRTTTLPGTVGTNLPQENLNSDRTRGYEIVLTHRNTLGDFSYNITANAASTRTMMRTVQQTKAGNSYENWKNSQADRYTNIWWGKQYGGQFTSYDQIYNHNVNAGGGNQGIVPGDYYYIDWNNDGVIDGKDESPIATRDIPLFNFGITLGAAWKGFDFNMLLQGATDFYVQYAEQMAEPLMYGRSALTPFLDRWHTADPGADVFDPNTEWVSGKYPAMGSPSAEGTKAVQDATYMRIKSLEFGYTIPKKLLSRVGITNLRAYINSYNLATFTGLQNSDPEHPGTVASGADWNYSQGGYKYPMNRTFSVGASITF